MEFRKVCAIPGSNGQGKKLNTPQWAIVSGWKSGLRNLTHQVRVLAKPVCSPTPCLAILGLLIELVVPATLRQLGSAKEKIAHQFAVKGIGHPIAVRQSATGADRSSGRMVANLRMCVPGWLAGANASAPSAFNPLGTAQPLFGAPMQ